jgi:hypothetical protein
VNPSYSRFTSWFFALRRKVKMGIRRNSGTAPQR